MRVKIPFLRSFSLRSLSPQTTCSRYLQKPEVCSLTSAHPYIRIEQKGAIKQRIQGKRKRKKDCLQVYTSEATLPLLQLKQL